MQWIWQDKGFPNFEFDESKFINFEKVFYQTFGDYHWQIESS